MKSLIKIIFGFLASTFIFQLTSSFVIAETERSATVSANRPGQEIRKAVREARCSIAQERINLRVERFVDLKDEHLTLYRGIIQNLTNIADRLDKQGYDTTKIRADYKILNEKIVKRATDYSAFISKLEATKQFACGESEGKFVDALKESRAAMEVVRKDTQDIREYYKNTIRADISQLKAQKPSKNE